LQHLLTSSKEGSSCGGQSINKLVVNKDRKLMNLYSLLKYTRVSYW